MSDVYGYCDADSEFYIPARIIHGPMVGVVNEIRRIYGDRLDGVRRLAAILRERWEAEAAGSAAELGVARETIWAELRRVEWAWMDSEIGRTE